MNEFIEIAQRNFERKQNQKQSIKGIAIDIAIGIAIRNVIEFGQKVENDTLTIKDALPVFLIGALICQIVYAMGII